MDEPVQRQDRTHPNYELNKFLHEALLMLDDRLHRGRLWVFVRTRHPNGKRRPDFDS